VQTVAAYEIWYTQEERPANELRANGGVKSPYQTDPVGDSPNYDWCQSHGKKIHE
jgi:hypothetical protein